jgi:hypothetical protein
VIHDVGILANYKRPADCPWPSVNRAGWLFESWGADTLAGFLLQLNNVYPCVTLMSEPLLPRYFGKLSAKVVDVEAALRDLSESRSPHRKKGRKDG